MNDISKMSKRIKEYLIYVSITQKELADKSGVSIRSISRFENGEDISLSAFFKILKALELNDRLDFLVPDQSKRPSSFLMNRDGSWKLAPAFDVTFSYNPNNRWLKSHQMLVNGKGDHIVLDDLIAAGNNMGLSSAKCNKIINSIKNIAENKGQYFEKAGVREKLMR